MADIRIKDLPTTASQTASDDFIALDGTVNGTRKIDASAPSFKTSVTSPSVAAPAATNLTLAGGSSGASLVLGQGTSGEFLFNGAATDMLGTTRARAISLFGSAGSAVQLATNLTVDNGEQGVLFFGTTGASVGKQGAAIRAQNSGAITTQAAAYLQFFTNNGTSLGERMRITSTGNILIGTTTDITGTGGLKVAGTSTASSTTSGALQVGSNVGLSGNAGGASYFGGAVSVAGATTAAAGAIGVTSADPSLRLKATGSVVADQNTYEIRNVGGASNTYLQFRTINDANSVFTTRMTLWNSGGLYLGTATNADPSAGNLYIEGAFRGTALNSPSATALTLGTASFGTALTFASATGAATFAGNLTVSGTGTSSFAAGSNVVFGGTTTAATDGVTIVNAVNDYTVGLRIVGSDTNYWVNTVAGGTAYWSANGVADDWKITSAGNGTLRGTLNVSSSTPSTGVGTGALQVAGGIYAGAASVFGSTLKVGGNIGGGNQLVGQFTNTGGNGFIEIGGSASKAGQILVSGAGDMYFYTNATAGTLGTQALFISSAQAATFAGSVTSAGVIVSPNTALFSADASLSSYSTTNGVYLNGHGAGWLRLSGSGSGTAQIQLNGGAAGAITMNTATANALVLNGTTGAATFAGAVTVNGTGPSTFSGPLISSFVYSSGLSSIKRTAVNGAGPAGVFNVGSDGKTINDGVQIGFVGKNSADVEQTYGIISSAFTNVTSGAASGTIELRPYNAGTSVVAATFSGSGATFAGTVIAPAATTARASMRIPHGTAPTSPVDGDMWTTTAGLYIRINGATVGPLS